MSDTASYYRPYEDGSESDADADAESSLYSEEEEHERRAAGPDFANFARQLQYLKRAAGEKVDYYPFESLSTPKEATESEFNLQNNILLVDSRDRDRRVFPQPTFFTIRLPRTYKHVTNIQLAQIKLLSAFFYFRADKYNISFPLYEEGRTTPTAAGLVSTITTVTIREGSYNINDLLTEIQLQCNNVPLFFDFPNGFTDFSELFTPTGDLTLNFNQPGDYSYDREHDTYVASPTMTQILSRYFPTNTLAVAQTKASYSLDETRVAYYYPVLKELVLDTANPLNAALDLTTTFDGSIVNRILYNFQGLNDTVVLQIIVQNLNTLDSYRIQKTFLYSPVNQYAWNYDPANNRVNVTASNLNNSIVNLLKLKYDFYLSQALVGTGLTPDEYNALVVQNTYANAVFNGMYRFLQRSIASNWGITYGTYSPEFYLNFANTMFLQNSCNLDSNQYKIQEYDNGILAENISSTLNPPHTSPDYWPRLQALPSNVLQNPQNLGFSYIGNEIIDSLPFTDEQGFININKTTRSIDIATDIRAANYTYFKFRSPLKQNLQVETLARPLTYRYPNYNAANYGDDVNNYFDLSYSFVKNVFNANMDNLGANPLNPIAAAGAPGTPGASYSISVLEPVLFYQLQAPRITQPGAALVKFPLTVTFAAAAGTFEDGFEVFMYHDEGVFNADVLQYRKESAEHYKYHKTAQKDTQTLTLTFNAVSANTYYFIVRSTNQLFMAINYTVSYSYEPTYTIITNTLENFNPNANPITPESLSNYNYATVYDPDILRLPSYSNLYHAEPQNPLLDLIAPKMGADAADVSDDLTDYRPYARNSLIIPTKATIGSVATDPLNSFSFQYLNEYDKTNQVYIISGADDKSKVLDTTFNPYTVTNEERDYKLIQWYSQEYIPPQKLDPQTLGNLSPATQPFTSDLVNIPGYSYTTQKNIRLGNGVVGFTFLATDGIWNLEELWFKSAVVSKPDPNDAIQYVGIFYTIDVYGKSYSNLTLSKAALVLEKQKEVVATVNETGGTYYQFHTQATTATRPIYGYSQNYNTMLNNPKDLYCAIAFKDSNTATSIYALAGSTVPYPEFSYPSSATSYFGVEPPKPAPYLSTPSVIVPQQKEPYQIPATAGQPPASIYYSQYEQSIPIITTGIQYLTDQEYIYSETGLLPYQRPINADAYSFYWENQMLINAEYLQSWEYKKTSDGRYLSTFSTQAAYTWTLDEIFAPWNSQTFAAFATTSTSLYALGIQETAPGPSMPDPGPLPEVRHTLIQEFTKADGQMRYLTLSTPTIQASELVQKFYARSNQYVISTYDYAAGLSRYYINYAAAQRGPRILSTIDAGHDCWLDPLSPYLYVLPYNVADDDGTGPGGDILYSIPVQSDEVAPELSTVANRYFFLGQPENTQVPTNRYRTITTDYTENIFLWTSQLANKFNQVTQVYQDAQLKASTPTAFYTIIRTSIQTFDDNIVTLQCGFGGSLWAVTAGTQTQTLYGGVRSQTTDTTITTAWQIFYPCFKARFTKKKNYLNTITDTTSALGDINQYPEYYHPQLFFYKDWTSFSNDCYGKFAKETAGRVAYEDLSGSGYIFNSYLYNIELSPSSNFNDSDPDSYYYV